MSIIRWGAPPDVVKFNLDYSMDHGRTWVSLAEQISGASYCWAVPTLFLNKTECLIKVTGYDSSGTETGTVLSDGPFAIEVFRLNSPDGGQVLTSGDSYDITWTTNVTTKPVAKTIVKYTKDNGRTWKKLLR